MKIIKWILSMTFMAVVLSAAAAEKPAFNVASYNLRLQTPVDDANGNGWSRRAPYVANLIQFHEFDIFGTQEGFKNQLDELKTLMPGYDYIGHGREDGKEEGEHSAIFYRTDKFDLLDSGDFWLSETPDRPGKGWDAMCVRICTWGKFRHKDSGREFLFFNLHMDHVGTTARVESAKLIKHRIVDLGSELPTFLTGDFNVDQNSPSYAEIIEGGLLGDAHNRARFVYENNGTFNNYKTSGFTHARIDHIFVTDNVEVKKYGVLTDNYRTALLADGTECTIDSIPEGEKPQRYVARNPSDHFPVMIAVELK